MTARAQRPMAWDSAGHRPGRSSGTPALLGAGFLALGVLAAVLRRWPPAEDFPVLLAAFIPYGLVADALALALFALALHRFPQRRLLAAGAAALILLLVQLSWQLPFYVRDDRPAATPSFTLLSLNLRGVRADTVQVMAAARSADILVLVEFTPPARASLVAAGLEQQFPHLVGGSDLMGEAIYSRFPLRDGKLEQGPAFATWSTLVDVPGLGPVRLVAAHPCNPVSQSAQWTIDHDVIRGALEADPDLPRIVAGDFNAVDDHRPLQQLVRAGMRSAADVAGAGWQRTYPANHTLPPLIGIDRVMIDARLTATSVRTVHIDGTDHLGVLATLAGTS